MTRYIVLILCLLLSSSGYSQNGLPLRTTYNNQPVVIISEQQMQMLLDAHISWEACTQENDSLLLILDSCTIGFHVADSAIYTLQDINTNDTVLIKHQQSAIDTLQSVINDQKRTIKQLKVHRVLSRIGEGILGIVIVWLLLR